MLILYFLLISVGAHNVLHIKGSEIEAVISINQRVLIRFCTTWSIECNITKQDYEHASLYNTRVVLAEVDVTNDTGTIERYSLFDYPTVIAFANKTRHVHIGDNDPESLLWFEMKCQQPLIHEIENQNQITHRELSSLIIITSQNTLQYKSLAEKYNDAHFYSTNSSSFIYEGKVYDPETIILHTKQRIFSAPLLNGTSSIQQLLNSHRISSINSFDEPLSDLLLKGYHDMIFLFVPIDAVGNEQYYREYSLASKLNDDMIFVVTSRVNKISDSFLAFLELNEADLPKVVIIHPTEQRTKSYRLNDYIHSEAITEFIHNWKLGNVKMYFKSEPIPATQSSQYVRKIVSLNFEEEVMQNQYDVIVKFYSLGCSHCEIFKPLYEEMAKKLSENNSTIKFVEIDANQNELQDTEILSYPTIYFYPANNKSSYIHYRGYRNEGNITQFLLKHAHNKNGIPN